MLLSELSHLLSDLSEIVFIATDGSVVPAHFHITEVGRVDRYFIDCGGAKRTQTKINLQLWTALDYDHRLAPSENEGDYFHGSDHIGFARCRGRGVLSGGNHRIV